MLDYIDKSDSNIFLNKKVNREHFNRNHNESNLSTKDVLSLLKKLPQSSSMNSNDLPPKLEFKYSHTLNSTDNTIKEEASIPTVKSKKDTNQFESYYKGTALIGGGLHNMGNTCFLNSVLQCLMYTLPFQNYLLNSDHSAKCKSRTVCFICELSLIVKSLQERHSISPHGIIRNIKLISKHIRIGRQEDAHEFFLFLLDSLEKAYNNYSKSTTKQFIVNAKGSILRNSNLIQNIFGGELSSEVVCLKCRHKSITNDQILTLSLELNNADSIERCLDNYCKSEPLFGSNKVYCDKCQMKNDSKKRFMFKTLPNVLAIHLKRFDNYQRKIQKFIKYNYELDMGKYIVSDNCPGNGNVNDQHRYDCKYRLYAILIHNGYSSNSGHYYSFLKSDKGWFEMNDSSVHKVPESVALNQAPYMIFYQKVQTQSQLESKSVQEIDKTKAKEESRKIHWQYHNINIDTIPFVYTNKREERLNRLKRMIKRIIAKNKYKQKDNSNHLMINESFNNSSNNNNISITEKKHEGGDEDTFALMMKNFGENVHKIDHQYKSNEDNEESDNDNVDENVMVNNKSKKKKNNSNGKDLMIKSQNLRSLYNSKNISLWDDDQDDNENKETDNKGRSKVSEQINFIFKTQNHFVPQKVKTKSEYDIKLDQGKSKKAHLKSNDNNYHHLNTNHFQLLSNRQLKQ